MSAPAHAAVPSVPVAGSGTPARVLLAYPPTGLYVRDERCQTPVQGMTAQPNKPPLDLAYIAAVFEAKGASVRIRDFAAEGAGWADFEEELRRFRPTLVLGTVTTPTLHRDLELFRRAKAIDPSIRTVAKGGHFTAGQLDVLLACPELDLALRGEAEGTIAEIAEGKPLAFVQGLVYRDGARLVQTGERSYLDADALDRLPFPARHLLRNDLYVAPDTGEPLTMIDTGRGCPHACVFCLVATTSGKRLRQRRPERIAEEMERCVKEHGIRNFFFRADTFTWDEAWTVQLCQEILRRGLAVRWGCNSRVDTISAERLTWMKKAGCWVVGFGLESGSQESLDRMKKRATLDDARRAVRLCREAGVKSYGMFLIGLPWEGREHVEATIRFMRELDTDFADVNVAYPLPGTEYFESARLAGLFDPEDLFQGDYARPIVRTEHLSAEDLQALRRRALLSFHLRPRYVARTLAGVRSPKVLLNYARNALRLVRQLGASSPPDA